MNGKGERRERMKDVSMQITCSCNKLIRKMSKKNTLLMMTIFDDGFGIKETSFGMLLKCRFVF